MSGIFISFRSADSAGHAGRLRDRLAAQFHDRPILMTGQGIEPGADVVETIEHTLSTCDVVLAVIGREWLICRDKAENLMLDNPNDFIRLELAFALNSKKWIIPLLVDEAMMPVADFLPEDLKYLCRRHGFALRDSRWDADMQELLAVLEKRLKPTNRAASDRIETGLTAKIRLAWMMRRFAMTRGTVGVIIIIAATTLWVKHLDWRLSWRDRSSLDGISQGQQSKYGHFDKDHQPPVDEPLSSQGVTPSRIEADQSFLGHSDGVRSLAALSNGQLVSLSRNEMILWELDNGESQTILRNEKNSYANNIPTAIFTLPDGRLVLGDYNAIRLWNPKSHKVETTLEYNKSDACINDCWIGGFTLLSDGRLVSWAPGGPLNIWNLKTNKAGNVFGRYVKSYLSLPNDHIAFVQETLQAPLEIWNLKSSKQEASLEEFPQDTTSLTLLADGRLASASSEGIITLWDLATGKARAISKKDKSSGDTLLAPLPNQQLLVARDNVINLWNLSTGEIQRIFKTDDKGRINQLVVISNLRFLSVSSSDSELNDIKLWNINTGQLEASFTGHGKQINKVVLLPNGKLASASDDKSIKLWTIPPDMPMASVKDQ